MSNIPVAIVTGGARGLGAGISVTLLKKGYKVCIASRQEKIGKEFVKEQAKVYGSGNVIFVTCDVSHENEYKKVFDTAIEEFGRLDLVINNAAILTEQYPREILDVNLMGTIIGCQLAMRYMGKCNGGNGGMVINVSSLAGFFPFDCLPVYTATKHGIIGLTRSYGAPYHFERHGVTFAALCPSIVDTQMVRDLATKSLIPGFDLCAELGIPSMTPEYAGKSVLKLLEDRINGSALIVTKMNGYKYIDIQDGLIF